MQYNCNTHDVTNYNTLGTPMRAKRYNDSNNDGDFNRRRAHRRSERDQRERERKERRKAIAMIVILAIITIVWVIAISIAQHESLERAKEYTPQECQQLYQEYLEEHPEQF